MTKLDSLASGSDKVIYEISSVFPFQLFPDRLTIDLNKITIFRNSFLNKLTFPVFIENILTLNFNRDIFFASLTFEIRGFETNPAVLTHLRRKEAGRAEQYILGLIKAKNEGINLSKIPINILREKLENIGLAKEITKPAII